MPATSGFFEYILCIKRLSLNTANTYCLFADLFDSYCNSKKIRISDINFSEIISFFIEKNYKNNLTISTAITSLISYGDYLCYCNSWQDNLFRNLERPRIINCYRTRYLSVEQVDVFLNSIDTTTITGLRDAALFELIYSSGLRCSEACNLEISNLNLQNCTVIIMGKGMVERQVPFGSLAKQKLNDYMKIARPLILMGNKSKYVFISNYTKKKLDRKNVWYRFQLYMEAAGLKTDGLCVHTLRHCFATHLLDGGADIETVRILLGHSLLTTTAIYTHISSKKLAECHSIYFRM